jgi:tetratricopeptide (TPR) repeat protein
VLTWDLRAGEDSLSLRVELLEVPGGGLLWSTRYDQPLDAVLAIQADIARTITDSLRVTLSPADAATLARTPTVDPAAYDLYLRGRQFLIRASPFGAAAAREATDSVHFYAERTIARDPGFAGGHFLRANMYLVHALRGWRHPFEAVLDTARTALELAFQLDSTSAELWVTRGSMGLYLTDNWPAVRRDLATGVRLNPDLAYGRHFYGIYLGELEGELDSAIAHLRHAVTLEPSALYYNTLGDLLLRARRYDSALTVLRQAVRLDPSLPGPWNRIVVACERTGRWREAVEARRQAPFSATAEAFAAALDAEGEAGYRRVLEREVRARIDSLIAAMGTSPGVDRIPPHRPGRIALLHAQLGEWDRAMDWVLRELEHRPLRFRWFVAHPDMRGLTADPRFLPLVRREGLEALLR